MRAETVLENAQAKLARVQVLRAAKHCPAVDGQALETLTVAQQRMQAVVLLRNAQAELARVQILRAAKHGPAVRGIGPAQAALSSAHQTLRATIELRTAQRTPDAGLIATARDRVATDVANTMNGGSAPVGEEDEDLAATWAARKRKKPHESCSKARKPNGAPTSTTHIGTVRAIRTARSNATTPTRPDANAFGPEWGRDGHRIPEQTAKVACREKHAAPMVEWAKGEAAGPGLSACSEGESAELTVTLPAAARNGHRCKVIAELVSSSGDDRVEVHVRDNADGSYSCTCGQLRSSRVCLPAHFICALHCSTDVCNAVMRRP
jgi:hypothetical protein